MASLNTLRTKFGWVLSVIIAVALLAFIVTLDDSVMRAMGMGGRDPKIGEMNGETIVYSEYADALATIHRNFGSPQDDAQATQMADAAWESIVAEKVYTPGFRRAGLRVTDAERAGLIRGEIFSPTLSRYFGDPESGLLNRGAITSELQRMQGNPQAELAWEEFVEGVMNERRGLKYGRLVDLGFYANRLEVDRALGSSRKFSGVWAGERYTNIPDTLYTPTKKELENYYREHKLRFRQLPSRAVSYVIFAPKRGGEEDVETRRQVHAQANAFAMNAKQTTLAEAAESSKFKVESSVLTQDKRILDGLAGSNELVHWINNAKRNEISPVIPIANDSYVVATVTAIDKEAYSSLAKVERQVYAEVMKEKKFAQHASWMKGLTLSEVASKVRKDTTAFSDVSYSSFFIGGLGMEPRMAGAIATSELNTPSAPIKGQSGIYVFEVTAITDAPDARTPESERARAIASIQQTAQNQLSPALNQIARVEDLRSRYF